MPTTLPLLREDVTYEEARQRETNTLHHLTYPKAQLEFWNFLYRRQTLIQKRVAHHLNVPSSTCQVAAPKDWMQGSFNLCIPVTLADSNRVLIRFPLPYRVGDKVCPGNADEKARCEAATYVWMQKECPRIPIPRLYGFALSSGQCFTAITHRPLLTRLLHSLRHRFLSWFGRPVPSDLIPHQTSLSNELGGYILIEYIDQTRGKALANTWETGRMNKELRSNLFRSLSRIILAMTRIHYYRVRSFIIDDQGLLGLENRPLTLEIQDLENDGIPLDTPRGRTFCTVDAYVDTLLSCHDSRLQYQPNAVNDAGDCVSQMCALVLLRALRPRFFDPKLNHGPFAPVLTDLNVHNIFVDDDWNVTCIIDLEWAAVLPLEFIRTPRWLTSQAVDEIDVDHYNVSREEFMGIFEKEEGCLGRYDDNFRCSSIVNRTWTLGTFWYVLALQSSTGLHPLLYDRIQPRFHKVDEDSTDFYLSTYHYWAEDANAFIKKKVQDRIAYDKKLREVFDGHPNYYAKRAA